jgi:ABC-type transport system involved in Fe-S cluster assembly fused permease/ATPase subunit
MLMQIMPRSPLGTLLSGLYYFACLCIGASFLGASIISLVTLQPTTKRKTSAITRRKVAICLSALIAVIYIVQSALFVSDNLRDRGNFHAQRVVVYDLLQSLTWTTLSLTLFDSTDPQWKSFTSAWTVALVIECLIVFLPFLVGSEVEQFKGVHLALQSARIVLLVLLSALGLSIIFADHEKANDDETQPLIPAQPSSPTSSHTQIDRSYAGTEVDAESRPADSASTDESGTEDSESAEFWGEERRKRIKDEGGWSKYIKEYLIFLPYIWPTHDRKFQLYFVVLGANILAERALNVLYPRQFGIVIDKLYESATTGQIPWKEIAIWSILRLLTSGSSGLSVLSQMLEARLANWSHQKLNGAAFDHVMGLSMSFHDGKDSGEVIRAVEQAGSLNSLLRTVVLDTSPVLLDLVIACWYLTFLLDAYAVVIVVFVGLSFIFVTYYITVVLKRSRRVAAANGRAESRILYEMVSNWATVSYFNRRKYEQTKLAQTIKDATMANQWNNDVGLLLFAAQEFCQVFGRFLVTVLAAYRIAYGVIPVGNFVALESYWDTITWPLWMLGHSYRQLASDLIDAERLLELFKKESEIQDGPLTLSAKPGTGKIEFSKVFFGYHKERNVIEDFSFTADPGQTIALVGETGSGKSTTLKTLMRFYDVTSGSITIDGYDVREFTVHSLREMFGFVPQNAALFNTSILENVRYGRLEASDEEVYQACRAAAIHDRIVSFPDGYNTKVGERGVKVSGGELQRIAIARVILKNPQIVLLDEATSALDTHTESKIQEALRNLTAGRTTIVIAHRLSTVTSADQILMVDKGRIVERGSHSELLQMGGRYVGLWEKQTMVSSRPVAELETETETGSI